MLNFTRIILISGLLALAGCTSSPAVPDPEPEERTYGDDAGANTNPSDYEEWDDGSQFGDDPSAGELAMIILFDFDSSEVRAIDTEVVSRHALQLAENRGHAVRLEGHADERGSREYNIGLGERRAQAVRRLLLIQGASASQIKTVSFGEERPAVDGSDESAWSQNRRVEIVYTN